ncbi:MAG: DUF1624 domain-containing protein [Pyrinomonadaceae bacterium]
MASAKERILSVDLLRGIVMIIMLLDHVREYVNTGGLAGNPTDLTKTTGALFLTRWITHFCAPTFVFLAGTSIYLQLLKGKSKAELTRFLLTRGIWLVVLEFTVVRLSLFFNVDYTFLGVAEVIWIFGVTMIVMAALVHLPVRIVGVIGVLIIALHNILDRFNVPPTIAFLGTPPPTAGQSLWVVLNQNGFVPLFDGATKMLVGYPVLAWIGVMAAGYALGSLYTWEAQRRRRMLFILGASATALFVVIRVINFYGDPAPWETQASPFFTFLSFLNTTKYPPSLLFVLMTLGPSLLVLAAADGMRGTSLASRIAINFGRVPLFYFILQLFFAHAAGVVIGWLEGKDIGYLFGNPDAWANAPPGHGSSLVVAYVVWVIGLVALYPLCVWYGNYKRRSGHWLLSYM